MKLLRWVISIFLILLSLPVTIYFIFGLSSPTQPMHKLGSHEIASLQAANDYVKQFQLEHARLPTTKEFDTWAKQAPKEFDLDGEGLGYGRTQDSATQNYSFSYWGGDAFFVWRSETNNFDEIEISPDHYFMWGSKIKDLLILGTALFTILFVAWLIKPKGPLLHFFCAIALVWVSLPIVCFSIAFLLLRSSN